ncbi:MAG: ABC transporter permease subunit [Candidatus Hodarchaeales archaeon]|jgi:ABC-type transport system involved in multi-copper enzyme maturation permease subunit
MSFVNRYGYTDYNEERTNVLKRVISLTWFTLKNQIWGQKTVIISLALLLFVSLILVLPFGVKASLERHLAQEITEDEETGDFFALAPFEDIFKLVFITYSTNFFLLLLFGFIGARIFAEDMESNCIENYFTRLPRSGYVSAKVLAVFLSYLTVVLVPVLMIWVWLGSAWREDLWQSQNVDLITNTIFFAILLCAFYTAVALGVSASTENKNYAVTVFIVGLVVAGPLVTNILSEVTGDDYWLLLNIQEMLSPIYWDTVDPPALKDRSLAPILASEYERMVGLDVQDAINLTLAVFAVCLFQVYRKILRRG